MNMRTVSIARSVAVIGGTAALMAGVTFAAFQTNTVTLADSQFTTTTDNLKIWNGSTFDTTPATGFNVTLTPGVESAKQDFFLANTSNAHLHLTAHVNGSPGPSNSNITLAGVTVKFYDDAQPANNLVATTTLNALASGQVPFTTPDGDLSALAQGNGGAPGTNGNYHVTLTADPLAMSGSTASISNIDLEFTGTAF